MSLPSRSATDIADCAYELFRAVFPWNYPVRAVSVSVSDFIGPIEQMNLFTDILSEQKAERLENTIDRLRKRYGNNVIQRAAILKDERLKKRISRANTSSIPKISSGRRKRGICALRHICLFFQSWKSSSLRLRLTAKSAAPTAGCSVSKELKNTRL